MERSLQDYRYYQEEADTAIDMNCQLLTNVLLKNFVVLVNHY
jgi:hypothetical protein